MLTRRDKMLDFASCAAEKLLVSQTGFLHRGPLIPLFDNLCYALTLFKKRNVADVQRGIHLLKRILDFALPEEHLLPTYLHNFPYASKERPPFQLPLQLILHDFGSILDEETKLRLTRSIEAHLGDPLRCSGERLIAAQLKGDTQVLKEVSRSWNAQLGIEKVVHFQEGTQPALTLCDLYMLLQHDLDSSRLSNEHPLAIWAALFDPQKNLPEVTNHAIQEASNVNEHRLQILWGDREMVHSLVCLDPMLYEEGQFIYPKQIPESEEERMELNFYVNHHPDISILVNGSKTTTFQVGDEITIASPSQTLSLKFKVEGEGRFFGHIMQENRPSQTEDIEYRAHDWRILLRTVDRQEEIKVHVKRLYI